MLVCASGAAATPGAVAVFPLPGSKATLPGAQITFRGLPASAIGTVQVTGSLSGVHTGRIAPDSDGNGGSFLPNKPFTAGETVTVRTLLNVINAPSGDWQFTIARPWGHIGSAPISFVGAGRHGVQHFHSRRDLQPAAVSVVKHGAAGAGDVFVAPQMGPRQDGPLILDPSGNVVWFQPVPRNTMVMDFRVQQVGGQPVLTWWQGPTNHGFGNGVGEIFDHSYRPLATVKAGGGLSGADLHEFLVTNDGDGYIIGASPVHWPGSTRPVIDSVVQEIDIRTGLVLFEWHALDHVPLSESYYKPANASGWAYDPYPLNSIAVDRDGNLIVSLRNTWAVYKIDHNSGAVIWTLGSSRNSFKMGRGAAFAFQHDLVVQPDGTLTMFDDGAGPPAVHSQSRAVRIAINTKTMHASLVKQYEHSPPLLAYFEGNAQALSNGDMFVGWGEQPFISEINRAGKLVFDAHFTVSNPNYRAYRFPWSAQPPTAPAVALSRGADGVTTVYASWNGATDVSSWSVLAGPAPGSLRPLGISSRHGFETAMPVHSVQPYFAVQPVGSAGQVLASSPTAGDNRTHLSIFGHTGFISRGGVGGAFVGCFASQPCAVTPTVRAGSTVVATGGKQTAAAGSARPIFFTVNAAGRSMLAHSRSHQLPVTVTVISSDGARASARSHLVSYRTSGSVSAVHVANAPSMTIVSHTAFVSGGGVGGVFVGCLSAAPCHAVATVSARGTVIARTGSEFFGAQDFGFVMFTLTSAGRSMLAHAHGNQLPTQITVTNGGDTATVQTVLVAY